MAVLFSDSHHNKTFSKKSCHIREKLVFTQRSPLNIISAQSDRLFALRVIQADNLSFLGTVQKMKIFEKSAILLSQIFKFGWFFFEL